MIRLENITKIYNEKVDDTKALDDVSLKIEDGEFAAVMGASGSGKSTLLKIIGCMDTPTAGKYFLDNTEVTVASRSQVHKLRKEKIGYVFQHFALMDYYTAYENIELPLLAANVKRKERKRIILKQMEHLGILSERNKLPGKMSGGQQQRQPQQKRRQAQNSLHHGFGFLLYFRLLSVAFAVYICVRYMLRSLSV